MTKDSASFEQLDAELGRAAQILDHCAGMIRDIPLEPSKENIRKIGDALANVFKIQHRIYRLEPKLMPDLLREAPQSKDEDT